MILIIVAKRQGALALFFKVQLKRRYTQILDFPLKYRIDFIPVIGMIATTKFYLDMKFC